MSKDVTKRRRRRRRRSSAPVETRTVEVKRIPHKYILAAFAVFIATIGIFHAFKFTAASVSYFESKKIVDNWSNAGVVKSQNEYEIALGSINNALFFQPEKPLYIEMYAQILEWGYLNNFANQNDLRVAKTQYLLALKSRPLWPATYANLAMIKWRLQEFDDELRNYLIKADELGSQSQEVHLLYTRLGISLYQSNHPFYIEFKGEILARIRAGLRNANVRPQLLAFLTETNSLKDICRWFRDYDSYTAVRHLNCKEPPTSQENI